MSVILYGRPFGGVGNTIETVKYKLKLAIFDDSIWKANRKCVNSLNVTDKNRIKPNDTKNPNDLWESHVKNQSP